MNIGQAIKALRKNNNENQGVFAKKIGITQSYLSLIESGEKTPSLDVLKRMAESMGIPLPVLFWFGIEREDVKEHNHIAYDMLKPSIDTLIMKLFGHRKINTKYY